MNWEKELENLIKAMEIAIDNNDYQRQEELSREIWEIKQYIN